MWGNCWRQVLSEAKNSWPKVKLGDHVDLLTGFPFKSSNYTENPDDIRLVRGDNVAQGYLRWGGVKRWNITEEDDYSKYELEMGDVILAMDRPWIEAGLKYAWVTKEDAPSLLVQRVSRIRGSNGLLTDYLRYIIGSPAFTDYIKPIVTGVAVPHISADQIKSFTFNLPPLPVQRKIAAVLSAYDDLIEVNTRRIRVLEEMAQAVYREWFGSVDAASLPEGWEVATVGDALSEIESGSRPKGGIDPNEQDVPSIGAENILGLGQYNYSSDKFVSQEFFDNMKKGHIKHKDVLLYKDGAKIGRKSMFRDGFPHEVCCINEHVFILRTNELCTQNYLYFWLDQPEMTENIINLNANAAQPGINQKGVKSLQILLPDQNTLNKFEDTVEPVLALLFSLAKRNANLRRTRDLLLPRLVSGEVSVEKIELELET
jgi:type I restriction enzyme S subunit